MTRDELMAKLIFLGFKKLDGIVLLEFKHEKYNNVIIIDNEVIYLNKKWETEQEFDLLLEDLINGPKRASSKTPYDRFYEDLTKLSKTP